MAIYLCSKYSEVMVVVGGWILYRQISSFSLNKPDGIPEILVFDTSFPDLAILKRLLYYNATMLCL